MSFWHDISKEDLEIDGDDILVAVTSDQWGSVWAVIKIADIEELLRERKSTPIDKGD